jgi:hypothetical protein
VAGEPVVARVVGSGGIWEVWHCLWAS